MPVTGRRSFLWGLGGASALAMLGTGWSAHATQGQSWPARPIRLVVTFPPGGSSDIVARILAPLLAEKLGQSVVIDNKPGAGSSIGAQIVAHSASDGYTLLVSNSAALSIAPSLLQKPGYDAVRSFDHLAYIGAVPTVFAVHPSVPVNTLGELVAWIREQAAPVSFGSGGAASVGHLVGEQFAQVNKLSMEHVPYRGAGPMRADLLSGHIKLAVDALPQNIALQKQGRVKLLALTSPGRVPQAPGIPSVAELGLPQLVSENFVGISAPAGLPGALGEKISDAVREISGRADFVQALQAQGFVTRDMEPAAFSRLIADQRQSWSEIARKTGARL
ncbi:Bug family tripartite tricarboxylate transporter substrate binding protein [Comamonas resistens]|uniref:Tripartite tricarboxylate transporter substrate binding protein n=1 Tax=Comamonas resistens TaxID=3046670 RepID=A0ABY8STR8_9BURK|nr:tripartite tricarboxylate transporter substrate binding protein [Comamonas resistens]MDL5037183.1 tripartite tricarboxylate transporter substrate binding protein [Comamonas resistens]WHS65621.1 tripartite tricarboxylate transporter substrate binding protein [Comamonas resistens]